MKTYYLYYAVLALLITGCSKSESGPENISEEDKNEENVVADYTLLTNNSGMLSGTLIKADAESLSIADANSGFDNIPLPELTFETDDVLTMYHTNADGDGKVTIHDFTDASARSLDVFPEATTAQITAKAVLNSGNVLYVAYKHEDDGTETYFVRAIDLSPTADATTDIALDFEPEALAYVKDRVFVLAYHEVTREHRLVVIDASTNTVIHTDNLGNNAKNIFKGPDGNIIIGYDELHVTIDSGTLTLDVTNYDSETAPNFVSSNTLHFDGNGRLYYAVASGVHSTYSHIPAVYDFDENNAVLYAFENFLTEAQRNFEFEIENTTFVNYDEANNLLLVGYAKSGGTDKGGLLRIKPVPEPAFVGNLDLDGIPYGIYIN